MSELREAWAKIKIGLRGVDGLLGVMIGWLDEYLPGILLFVLLACVLFSCGLDTFT